MIFARIDPFALAPPLDSPFSTLGVVQRFIRHGSTSRARPTIGDVQPHRSRANVVKTRAHERKHDRMRDARDRRARETTRHRAK